MTFQGSEENYIRNRRLLLEESASLFHGKTNPIPFLSVNDLNTSFHDWVLCLHKGLLWKSYKCFWEERPVFVKIFTDYEYYDVTVQYCREIVVAAQMGTHENVHKLLACCLETQNPVLIYEYASNGPLGDVIYSNSIPVLEWKDRFRIAWEISGAVSYLHSAFPRPIIHRSLTPWNVFLGQDNVAKLSDFSLCVSIPEGETKVEDRFIGTRYFVDPEYLNTSTVTEKADVFVLGVLLLGLLTGASPGDEYGRIQYVSKCLEQKKYSELVDLVMVWNGVTGNENLQQQVEGCVEILVNCMAEKPDSRPSMEEVSTQLKNIIALSESLVG